MYKEDDDEKKMVRTFYSSSVFEFKNLREKVETPCFFGGLNRKSKTEEILTSPSFRVLYETLNTRVKKKLREREREKRKDQKGEEFFPFSQKARKKGKRLALFLYSFYPASLLYSTRSALCDRERRVRRWCSFCPAMVALFHPRRRVLFYHHQ